jgi:hypothetical protein
MARRALMRNPVGHLNYRHEVGTMVSVHLAFIVLPDQRFAKLG